MGRRYTELQHPPAPVGGANNDNLLINKEILKNRLTANCADSMLLYGGFVGRKARIAFFYLDSAGRSLSITVKPHVFVPPGASYS